LEITNPANGATLGFDSGGTAALSGTASADTGAIDVFYTKSDATSAQKWIECSDTQTPIPQQPTGSTIKWNLNCNTASGDASKVTAVAVVPYSQNQNPGPPPTPLEGAGDAHRVTPFVVAPNSVVISPASVSQSTNDCQLFTAQILDSTG